MGGAMDDTRIALVSGTKLFFGKEQSIMIQEVIGCGASCFVYNATYQDSRGLLHNVRIKECYPYGILLERKEDNSLSALSDEMKKFERAKEQFFQAYERNAKIKRISELLNSTGTVSEIVQANGTVYSILSYEEGKDYQQYQDASLQEVLEHIKAVAQVIQKYHENGYLHLDIKPENIFVFPETAQHILLFDFDSVIRMEEWTNGNFRLAVSDGFSAPEQLQGKLDKIGVTTDIYALGAVLFYKIFGRTPTLHDCNLDATYNFSNMIYKDDRYQPKLYKGLELLFRKSICISSMARWKDMRLFIAQIEQLLPLADPTIVFVQQNFSYHSNCFVGRNKDLEELQNILEEKKVVFLSGIGGIGKTELAKRYAYLNQKEYDRIIFISFSNSVEETICSNDILIQNEAWEENSTESLFESRMRVMKKDLTGNDLFILDNFDVDKDDNLEYLLECRCKFIITSRNDFRDYNYPQMNIEKIEDEEEVLELFSVYNQKEYSQREWKSISSIIQLVDNHTMTVELISKYLRDTEESPSQLLGKLMEKEGITSLQEMEVKHRKDKKMSIENIDTHLLILFQISNFSDVESELMRSLALLGYIRILRSSFLKYCNVIQKEECLEHLIKTGWIEYDEKTEKISLHQIILDLVYNHMKPTAQNCPNIVEAMSNYLLEELKDPIEKDNRSRLCRSFMTRLRGNSLAYAKLCVLHGHYSNMNLAERICLESKELEAKNLLYQIYRWKLRKIAVYDDVFIAKKNADIAYYENKIKEVLDLTEKALQYAKDYSLDKTYQLKVRAEIGKQLNLVAGRPFVCMPVKLKEKMKQLLYEKIIALYQEAEILFSDAILDNKEKIALLEQILRFYYLGDFPVDLDKLYFYQQMKDMLKEQEGEINDFQDIKLEDVAEKAYLQKEYNKALTYYKQVLEKGTENTKNVLEQMSDIYVHQLNISKAIECLEQIKDMDKKCIAKSKKDTIYETSAYFNLIETLSKKNRKTEVKKYVKEQIIYPLQQVQRKKIIKQLDLWCWAAGQYYDKKNIKMDIMCLERVIELIEKCNTLNNLEFSKYWRYILFLLHSYAMVQKTQELKDTAIRAYQITINFYCKKDRSRNIELNKLRENDIFWNSSDIAVVFEENGYEEEALLFYMVAISSINTSNILELNQKVLKAIEEGLQGKNQMLIDELHRAIHGKLLSIQVQMIIETYENMRHLLKENKSYIKIKKELEWFLKQYQQQEIEFKREE